MTEQKKVEREGAGTRGPTRHSPPSFCRDRLDTAVVDERSQGHESRVSFGAEFIAAPTQALLVMHLPAMPR